MKTLLIWMTIWGSQAFSWWCGWCHRGGVEARRRDEKWDRMHHIDGDQ